MEINTFYKLRKNWFSLKAKEFIKRYFMGIVILVIFLPGVAIGENFNLLVLSITKPFVLVSQIESPFIIKQLWLFILITIFVVWSRAQRSAVKGGDFAVFQESLPLTNNYKNKINVRMLLVANHFLWPVIIASYFYFPLLGDSNVLVLLLRNSFLILLLIVIQYIVLFKYSYKFIVGVLILSLFFTLPLNFDLEFYRLAICYSLMIVFVFRYLFKEEHLPTKYFKSRILLLPFLTRNFHSQIIFKSGLTSSLFRFMIIVSLMIGFTFSVEYWVDDYAELTPYYFVLEAILAYFVSGFYVSFLDQRNSMKDWLITLPIKKHYWIVRDILAIVLLTSIVHVLFFVWATNHSEPIAIIKAFSYHLLLLVVSYPLRVFLPEKQTFITFVVLFIITAITLFNLS